MMGNAALPTCAIVNAGPGAWAFAEHAERLSRALWLDISTELAEYSYLLCWEGPEPPLHTRLFIPYTAIQCSADKRRLAELFQKHSVPTPRTYLCETPSDVQHRVQQETEREWVLKWPTGVGGAGHRLQRPEAPVPADWPRPYVLQEFIRNDRPEVYRLYCAAGQTFGWNVRRYPVGVTPSPWVAHARGACYEEAGLPPAEAERAARTALVAVGLWDSFGCVDLICAPDGRWLVLEANTDGLFSHIDREVGLPRLAEEIDRRVAEAFWAAVPTKPWGEGPWRPRSVPQDRKMAHRPEGSRSPEGIAPSVPQFWG